jgi:hypothetical protein
MRLETLGLTSGAVVLLNVGDSRPEIRTDNRLTSDSRGDVLARSGESLALGPMPRRRPGTQLDALEPCRVWMNPLIALDP